MMELKSTLRNISLFLVPRFPFINAVTLLMLLGERATREKYPPLDPMLIYTHLGMMVVCGVCMGFNMARRPAALLHCGQLLVLAYTIYGNEKLKYSQWLKIRMCYRGVGVAGVFLLYAFFTAAKPRNPQLRRMGETLFGIYLLCAAYTYVESAEDKSAFLALVPGGKAVLYVYTLLVIASALCFIPGYFVNDVGQILIYVLLSSTALIDCRFQYWTRKRGVDYWNQCRMLADSVCIILGLLMYLTCTTKKVYGEPEHEKQN